MSFKKTVRIFFDQGDPANITFHGEHPVIAQRVFEEYVEEGFNIPWKEWFRNPDFFMPVVKLYTDYKKPLHPGQDYVVEAQIIHLGRSSVHCDYKIFTLSKEECCAISAVYVCVDRKTLRSRPLPEKWIPTLKKHCKNGS